MEDCNSVEERLHLSGLTRTLSYGCESVFFFFSPCSVLFFPKKKGLGSRYLGKN